MGHHFLLTFSLSVIVIGGQENMKTKFTCNKADISWTNFETPKILSAEESRTFFLSFANNLLKLRRVGGEALFTHNITLISSISASKSLNFARPHNIWTILA